MVRAVRGVRPGGAPGSRGRKDRPETGGTRPRPAWTLARRASGHLVYPRWSLRGRRARSFSRSSVPGGALTGHASESGGRRGRRRRLGGHRRHSRLRACERRRAGRPGPAPSPQAPPRPATQAGPDGARRARAGTAPAAAWGPREEAEARAGCGLRAPARDERRGGAAGVPWDRRGLARGTA